MPAGNPLAYVNPMFRNTPLMRGLMQQQQPAAPMSTGVQQINEQRQVQYPPGLEPVEGAPLGAPSNFNNPMPRGNQMIAQNMAQGIQGPSINPLMAFLRMQGYGGGGYNPLIHGVRGPNGSRIMF